MAAVAAGVYHHHGPFLLTPTFEARALTHPPAAVPAATTASAQTPTLLPLTPVISFSEYFYSYSPILKLGVLDSRLYPALNSSLHQLISTTTTAVPNPATPLQLATTLILITIVSLFALFAYTTWWRRFISGSDSSSRRHSRRAKRGATTTTLGGKRTPFRVQELYESNVLVSVADVPRGQGQPQHGCEDGGSCDEYNNNNKKSFPPKLQTQLKPPPNGLVTKEEFLRAEDLENKSDNDGWFRVVKTRVLLLARPPVGLLK